MLLLWTVAGFLGLEAASVRVLLLLTVAGIEASRLGGCLFANLVAVSGEVFNGGGDGRRLAAWSTRSRCTAPSCP